MSLNLFNKNNSTILNLIDWYPLINHLIKLFQFKKTKDKVNSFFSPSYSISQQTEFESIEFFQNDLSFYYDSFNKSIKFLDSQFNPYLLIEKISKEDLIEIKEVNSLCVLFDSFLSLKFVTSEWNKNDHFLLPHDKTKALKKSFLNPLRKFVEDDGTIYYERHPILKPLFAGLKKEEVLIKSTLNKIIKSKKYSDQLQFEEYDIINDRFVIPIKADSYNYQQGSIIARSSSGKTLFIEPTEIKKNNNSRIEILAQLDNETIKITKTFASIIHNFADEFLIMGHFLFELDYSIAKSYFCHSLKLSKPEFSTKPSIKLDGFFHPLIENPIKNDLSIDKENHGLVISGPNTGGKTVTLKSLALCHILFKLGFYIPAQFGSLFPFDGLFYFSNDQQDLEKGLSSFSSETNNYLNLLQEVQENKFNIIFIDEIFNSTSSEEASSLALGLLEEIQLKSDSKVIISTHHQLFKTFIHNDNKYISSHVGFDFQTNRPNFKLNIGSPGSSMALKIFKNICHEKNISPSILNTAQKVLDKKQVTYENLLEKLSKEKNKLNKLVFENESLKDELKNQKQSMKGLLLLEKEKELNQYKRKIQNLLLKSENLLKKVQLKNFNNKSEILKDSSEIKNSILLLEEKNTSFPPKKDSPSGSTPAKLSDLKEGQYYFSTLLSKKVKILSLKNKQNKVLIVNNTVKMWVPFNTLLIDSSFSSLPENKVRIYYQNHSNGKTRIDCRGMKLDQFKNEIEESIINLLNDDIPFLEIIHGHGEGILKGWLRNHLKKSFQELDWSPMDGNDGTTIITNTKKK